MKKAISLSIIVAILYSCASDIFKNSENSRAEEIARSELNKQFMNYHAVRVISAGDINFKNKKYKKTIAGTEIIAPGRMRIRVEFKKDTIIKNILHKRGDVADIDVFFVVYMLNRDGEYSETDFVIEDLDN